MQRFVLLQPPLPAERGCAAAVAAGEELQPGAADTFASAYAVHRPSTASSSDWFIISTYWGPPLVSDGLIDS